MREIKLKVESIKPNLQLGKATVTTYGMEAEIESGKIKLGFVFEDPIPSNWRELLGDSPGNEILITIGVKSRQTKLTD